MTHPNEGTTTAARAADSRDGPVPVIILAVLGLIPGLGLVFAAAALTWALVANRRGMLVAGILAAVTGIANIVAIVVFTATTLKDQGGVLAITAGGDLAKVVTAIEKYRDENGRYPEDLEVFRGPGYRIKGVNVIDLAAGFSSGGPTYQYRLAADDGSYTVFSAGRDRTPGTDDDIVPVFTNGRPVAPGYRPPEPDRPPPEEPR